MKIKTIALEEHWVSPRFVEEQNKLIGAGKMVEKYYQERTPESRKFTGSNLMDLDKMRIADMDKNGIDVAILQMSGHSLENMSVDLERSLCREANDYVADKMKKHPDRFKAFIQLHLQDPEGSAAEIERCMTKLDGFVGATWSGKAQGVYLDDPRFTPIFEVMEKLGVPFYIHPGVPTDDLSKAMYADLPDDLVATIQMAGWGWHMDNGWHTLRMVVTGLFDRFPKLRVINGHMGEFMPAALARMNSWLTPLFAKRLERTLEEYFIQNTATTTSGFFSLQPLHCCIDTLGIDNIMFAVDFPYSTNEEGRQLLDAASLALSVEDFKKLSYKNAERILKL